MPTKWEVYEALEKEFNDSLPQKADDLEISIHEAACDRFGKEWDEFHKVRHEEFINAVNSEVEDRE